MQSATGSGCCFEEKRKMKRNIDICRRCGKFHHDDSEMMCLASEDTMYSLLHFMSEKIGIPKSFFFGEEDVARQGMEDAFSEKDVPDDCEMKDVYLVCSWTNEKKA